VAAVIGYHNSPSSTGPPVIYWYGSLH